MFSDSPIDPISEYLHYGYRPSYVNSDARREWSESMRKALSLVEPQVLSSNLEEWAARGEQVLDSVFRDLLVDKCGLHVVPISGGYDSRAILAWLRRNLGKESIATVTFGTPGALDYELGRQVAKAADVRHEAIDLTQVPVTRDLMLETVRDGAEWTYLPDAYYNRLVYRYFGSDATYWGGYAGGVVAGSRGLRREVLGWGDALRAFVRSQQRIRSVRLASPTFDPASVLPSRPYLRASQVSLYEQLDMLVRQIACIRPIVENGSVRLLVPFAHPRWISFMMGAPNELRSGAQLYQEVIRRLDPTLSSLPLKQNYGLPIHTHQAFVQAKRGWLTIRRSLSKRPVANGRFVNPFLNYIDMDQAVCHRKDVQEMVRECINRLEQLEIVPWMDLTELMQKHGGKGQRYGDALMLLVALEVNVAAKS